MNFADWADENLRRFGDYDAVVVHDRVWTNAALHDRACRLASALLDRGIQPGDCVLLLLPNCAEMVIAFAAILRSGGVAVPMFAGAGADEIARIVALAAPSGIVTTAGLAPTAQAAAAAVPVRIVVGADGAPGGWAGFDALIDRHEPLPASIAREPGDPAVICYTSGTSGAPKGVVHTHGGVHARHGGAPRRATARVLLALPLNTVGAVMLTGRLAHRWTLILLDKFEPRPFLAAIEQHRATQLVMMPSMGEALAALPDAATYNLASLRDVFITGADVPPALLTKLSAVLSINPSVTYGMTETGGGITSSGLASKPGSVGRILKGVDVKIVGEHGEELPRGEVGEILVRTPWMGAGYYRQPEETAAAFAGGWIRTGDLGHLDDDRELFVVGRRKDLIIQSGVKVAPRDVVEVIRGMPGVEECAVVGMPHAVLGEQVVACVVRAAAGQVTEDEILARCRAHLDPRKVPVRVRFCLELPKTLNGKVKVQELREQLIADRSAVIETGLVRRLRSVVPTGRAPLLRDAVHQQVLRFLPADRARTHSPDADAAAAFGELGLDSLRLAQLGHALEEILGRPITPTLFFSHPTVDALCRHLVAEIAGTPPVPAPPPAKPVAAREPVAIIGFGCRLPGGADTPGQFWSLLRNGVDATAEISRWNVDALYDPERGTPGRIYTRRAALLDGADLFDAGFFGISPREAVRLDPQHRLVLEVTWEALEHAGYDPRGVAAGAAGLFLGISGAAAADGGFGSAPAMAVGRVCHFLDLRGPAAAVDTLCSSSLAAVHHAIQSLRLGECHLAIAGGVQVIGSLRSFVGLSEMSLMAADGRCKTFAASADGFGRGEGCVLIALKRLSDAQADRDRIVAVIRGSAMRHDGRSASLTAPNGRAQQEVIRAALADAGAAAAEVDYLEAHGTGTALGDPTELQAAMAVFADRARPLVVGSVKTNIGHLETAAGAAGLMKVALALEHGEIPAHLHCDTLNPLLEPLASTFIVPAATWPWPETTGRRRLAGVTSMGLSGTNVHVVVEEAPAADADPPQADVTAEERPQLLCLSARTAAALDQQARRYADHFDHVAPDAFADHCFTANAGRAHFQHRLAVVARSPAAARDRLLAPVTSGVPLSASAPSAGSGATARPRRSATREGGQPDVGSGQARTGIAAARPKVAFLFTGIGSEYVGMGRQLYETAPAFRRALLRCAGILEPLLPRPLMSALYAEPPVGPVARRLDEMELCQPALFAFEWALCELWKSWGVEPDAVMGHGVGECVAACVAGLMTLEDGLALTAARGRLMQSLPPLGAMVSCASHSHLVDPVLSEFEQVAAGVTHSPLRTTLVSTVTGRPAAPGDLSSPAYWRRHMREPVQVEAAVAALAAEGCDIFVEIGPQPVLTGMGRDCLAETSGTRVWLPSLRKDRDDREQILETLADLYVRGVDPDWAGFHADRAFRRVALPTYPFQRTRYARTMDAGAREAEAAALRRASRRREDARMQASAADDGLAAAASRRQVDALIESLRQQIAETAGCTPESLALDQNCLELGLDSLGVLDVVAAVRDATGIACTPADFMARPTIAGFAALVAGRLTVRLKPDATEEGRSASPAAPESTVRLKPDTTGDARVPDTTGDAPSESDAPPPRSRVVALNDRGSRIPIFCMHPSGGQATAYLRLRGLLGREHPVYALQSRALHEPEHEHPTIESMAAEYATLVQGVRPGGPYRLLGWSMGGLIAHAVASELERRGARVDMVGMIDVVAPDDGPERQPSPDDLALALTAIIAEVQPSRVVTPLAALDLAAAHAVARPGLLAWCEARGHLTAGAVSSDAFDAMLRLYQRHFQMVREHHPGVVDAPIVEWRASAVRRGREWSAHSRAGVIEKSVGGNHFSIMRPPHIGLIAADLESGLARGAVTALATS